MQNHHARRFVTNPRYFGGLSMLARTFVARTFVVAPVALCLLALTGLTACGDDEPNQRKAFIEFLQTRIINKPGLHVPTLTADESARFGDYAKHYAVIADFNGNLDRLVSNPMGRA